MRLISKLVSCRRGRAFGVVLCLLLVVGILPLAARTYEQQFVDYIQGQILKEAERLAGDGFEPAHRAMIEMNRRSDLRRFVLRLEAGTTYALVAACDQDCDHVTLAILDEARQPMTATRERAGVVLLTGTPDRSGHYEVELTLPGCRERSCHTGLAILRRGEAPAAAPVVVASSTGTARTPLVAGAAFGMERRPGLELTGSNYVELAGTSLADCERRCLADSRCRALEFYVERRSCGLFDRVPGMRRARGIDVSVKVSGN